MKRGIDHLVLAVRDLDRARETYARLGFTTTPRAQHSWGTDNSLVQFDGNFLELLTLARPEALPAPRAGAMSFGLFNQTYLARREGFSMLVFESRDAAGDRADFAAAGLPVYEPFDFQRQATLPDGSNVTVGFSLTFTSEPAMPEAGFFTCQQHAPQYFWKPEYQRHENGARQVAEAVIVAPQPSALTGFLEGLEGADAVRAGADGVAAETGRGTLRVVTPDGFAARFGGALPAAAPTSPHLAGYAVSVPDTGAVADLLARNGIAFANVAESVVVGPEVTFGTYLAFVAG